MNKTTVMDLASFWNETFARDQKKNELICKLVILDYATGRQITLDGAIIDAFTNFQTLFFEYREYLSQLEEIEKSKPKETPVPKPKKENTIVNVYEVVLGKKKYFVELHRDGTKIVQTENGRVLVDGSAVMDKVLKALEEKK